VSIPTLKTNQETEADFDAMVASLVKPGENILVSLTPQKCHLLHMVLGIAGEAGELVDAVKKHVIYDKVLDLENVVEECADVLFYLSGMMQSLGITPTQCRTANMAKLAKRYPNGYTNQAAITRADKQ
jgi:NTP pyrophosphatase (non-canonical NTP hydrolase)